MSLLDLSDLSESTDTVSNDIDNTLWLKMFEIDLFKTVIAPPDISFYRLLSPSTYTIDKLGILPTDNIAVIIVKSDGHYYYQKDNDIVLDRFILLNSSNVKPIVEFKGTPKCLNKFQRSTRQKFNATIYKCQFTSVPEWIGIIEHLCIEEPFIYKGLVLVQSFDRNCLLNTFKEWEMKPSFKTN